jgi:ABC-type nickel/cobalt efflux system permease component RcnA
MNAILYGSLTLSVLHALIPSHWLPFVTIGQTERWSLRQTLTVTAIAGLAHTVSTTLLGVLVGLAGWQLAENYHDLSERAIPLLLLALGMWYLMQHLRHRHVHDHIDAKGIRKNRSFSALLLSLGLAMFLSPCLEIDRVAGASLFPQRGGAELGYGGAGFPNLQRSHTVGHAPDGVAWTTRN